MTETKSNPIAWRLGVIALAISSGFVTLWNLAAGERSEYYASIAMSMSKSFSNFFFGAIDPAGTISLDKIPGSYWASAIFVKLFGFSTWAVNAPNALATIGVVLVIAFSIKNLYGPRAGLIAGFLVAGVPVAIAVARSNQPESMFVLMMSLALWQALKAFKFTSRKHLIFAGAWVAAAFQMYMIVAWAVWPALILAWFFTQQKLGKKIVDLAIAGFTSLALSLLWIVIVWLTPAANRPYVGGTYKNSAWEMVFGYNALGRFSSDVSSSSNTAYRSFTPPFGGTAGIDRLFNYQLSGQVSWLIPATVVAIVALIVLRQKLTTTIFLAGWFVTFAVMFSAVAGLHQFYVTAMVIPMVALIAMAIEAAREAEKKIWIALIVGVTAVWAIVVGLTYADYLTTFPYMQLVLAVATIAALYFGARLLKTPATKGLLTAGIVSSLALTPAAWAVDTMNHPSSINPAAGPASLQMGSMGGGKGGPGGSNGGFGQPGGMTGGPGGFSGKPPVGSAPGGFAGKPPMGGPGQMTGNQPGDTMTGGKTGGWSPTGMSKDNTDAALISYLKSHRGSAKYLVAVFGAQTAAPIINATGENVLPIGGFDGSDPAPTLAQFKQMVASGEVKYVLSGGNQGMGGGMGGGMNGSSSVNSVSSQIQSWVTAHFIADTAYKGTGTLLVYSK